MMTAKRLIEIDMFEQTGKWQKIPRERDRHKVTASLQRI